MDFRWAMTEMRAGKRVFRTSDRTRTFRIAYDNILTNLPTVQDIMADDWQSTATSITMYRFEWALTRLFDGMSVTRAALGTKWIQRFIVGIEVGLYIYDSCPENPGWLSREPWVPSEEDIMADDWKEVG